MKKIEWKIEPVGKTVLAATPESAANLVFGTNYGHHWEASKTKDSEWWYGDLSNLPTAESVKGKFYLFHMEHG